MTSPAEILKYQEENLLLKRQIEERTGKTVEQLYVERAQRVRDAIELRVPDRVPFSVLIEPHAYSGIPNSAAYYDPITLKRSIADVAIILVQTNKSLGPKGIALIAIDKNTPGLSSVDVGFVGGLACNASSLSCPFGRHA
jgi:hypothetical protein